MTTRQMKVIARFQLADTGKPLIDRELRVRFYDADLIKNDFLGESSLDDHGRAEVVFDRAAFQSGLLSKFIHRLKEQKPDIYCEIVEPSGTPVFRSTIRWNVGTGITTESPDAPPEVVDLGTYAFRQGDGLQVPGFYAGIQRPLF